MNHVTTTLPQSFDTGMFVGVNPHFAFRKQECEWSSVQLSRSGLGFDMGGEIKMLSNSASGSHFTQKDKLLT